MAATQYNAARFRANVATGLGGFVEADPGTPDPGTPTADALTDLPGWQLQSSSNFKALSVLPGTFLSTPAYGGTQTASDILNMKFDAFPTTFADTRSNHLNGRTITGCKVLSGNTAVFGAVNSGDVNRAVTGTDMPTGAMVLSYAATGPDIGGYGTGPRLTLNRACTGTSTSRTVTTLGVNYRRTVANLTTAAGSTSVSTDADIFLATDDAPAGGVGRTLNSVNIPPRTTIVTVIDARNATISNPASTSGTANADIGRDYGVYDIQFSVANGILSAPIWTDDAGMHHVACVRPKWNGSGNGTCQGGRWQYAFKCDALPTYKVAYLMWPASGGNISGSTSGTGVGGNGEIDFIECNLSVTSHIGGFMHWQDGTGGQSSSPTTQLVVDSVWHIYTVEWRPNADRVSSTLEFFIDGVSIKKFTGSNVPNQPMNPRFQCETMIDDEVKHVDPATNGFVRFAYIAFWKMV